MRKGSLKLQGFTLIELSIVLVIIGLIVGGVLAGRDLIKASEVRATITQIEKFNTAANTFFGKYGYLPGDIPANPAAQFGLAARGALAGEGDGNGLLEANYLNTVGSNYGTKEGVGETAMFWVDLSATRLIDGGFSRANSTTMLGSNITASSSPSLSDYLPPAKLGGGNFFYVWSGGVNYSGPGTGDNTNYFGLSAITQIEGVGGNIARADGNVGLTVKQAYDIDAKIDDGSPQAGRVQAFSLNGNLGLGAYWAAGGGVAGASPGTSATASSTTCFDNGGNTSNNMAYSVTTSNGANVNCALSFKMQAGD